MRSVPKFSKDDTTVIETDFSKIPPLVTYLPATNPYNGSLYVIEANPRLSTGHKTGMRKLHFMIRAYIEAAIGL